ncbi:hypothetical protein Q7P36_010235 [Cladosporium allicinum]
MSTEEAQNTAAAATNPGQEAYEEEHVHSVYEQIASHFSSTRYKPWPIIERFLQNLEPGSVGLDVGCGNGKYLAVNRDVFIVASDRSTNLAAIATTHQPHAVAVADILSLPHPLATFDFAISIAVIHHLSTSERRSRSHSLHPRTPQTGRKSSGGKVVKKPKGRGRKRSGGEGDGEEDKEQQPQQEADKTFHRYYHLYRQGELEENVRAAGGVVVEAGYEKDNWWAIAERA